MASGVTGAPEKAPDRIVILGVRGFLYEPLTQRVSGTALLSGPLGF